MASNRATWASPLALDETLSHAIAVQMRSMRFVCVCNNQSCMAQRSAWYTSLPAIVYFSPDILIHFPLTQELTGRSSHPIRPRMTQWQERDRYSYAHGRHD